MKRRIKLAVSLYKSGSVKTAVFPLFDTAKGILLTGMAAAALTGPGIGYVTSKVTESSGTDIDNAKLAYGEGNLRAAIASNLMKLKKERNPAGAPVKTMRLI